MTEIVTSPRTKVRPKTERPRLYKVILLNDDFTPREFVITVLKMVFRMSKDQAYRIMMTAHRRGVCVVAVYTKDVAESKATRSPGLTPSAIKPKAAERIWLATSAVVTSVHAPSTRRWKTT